MSMISQVIVTDVHCAKKLDGFSIILKRNNKGSFCKARACCECADLLLVHQWTVGGLLFIIIIFVSSSLSLAITDICRNQMYDRNTWFNMSIYE